jgi:hypothetical protein
MVAAMFSWLDGCLAVALPEAVRLVVWGGVSGVASMGLFAVTSPQQRLRELKEQTLDLQKQLSAYDGDFSGAMALTRQNLALSMRRLGWALWPSLLAGVPVVLVLLGIAELYSGQQVLSIGPGWVRSWLTTFFTATTVAALGTKFAFKIE